jgi:hypothetical protein
MYAVSRDRHFPSNKLWNNDLFHQEGTQNDLPSSSEPWWNSIIRTYGLLGWFYFAWKVRPFIYYLKKFLGLATWVTLNCPCQSNTMTKCAGKNNLPLLTFIWTNIKPDYTTFFKTWDVTFDPSLNISESLCKSPQFHHNLKQWFRITLLK